MPQDAGSAPGPAGRMQGWQPATFRERGVAVPFTTPHLAGGRLRAGVRGTLEIVLPEIVGRGSVGILQWDSVGSLCSPSLFDRRLGTRLAALPLLTPAAVREAACAEAASGLAGEEAQAAAGRARQDDAADSAHAGAALAQGAATGAVAELAALFGPVGLGNGGTTARLPRIWAAVVAALVAARALAADMPALRRRAALAPAPLAEEVRRAEWLLDGWAWLCGFWDCRDARPGHAEVALPEIAALVPPLPREVTRIPGTVPSPALPDTIHDGLRGGDWRSGVTHQDLIARNEWLLARTLALPEEPA